MEEYPIGKQVQLPKSNSFYTLLADDRPASVPHPAAIMTGMVEVAPGDPGTPPHRHSGPVFGYMLEGEIIFELEGDPERIIKAGEAFWEPGGDVIHYQSANNLQDSWARFLVVMMCVPGQPMLALVDEAELASRRDRRARTTQTSPSVSLPGSGAARPSEA